MRNKLIILKMAAILLLSLTVIAQAEWHFQPGESVYEYAPNTSFTVEIILSGSGAEIDAFGFDLTFPHELLQYEDKDFTGTLLESWAFKDVNEYSPGVLKIAGFNVAEVISPPAAGIWIKLNLKIKEDASGGGEFTIGNFGDDLDGSSSVPASFEVSPSSVPKTQFSAIDEFGLFPNYPNPFNGETIFEYQLPENSKVELTICNLYGQKIKTIVRETKQAGLYRTKWDGTDGAGERVSSGLYFCHMRAGNFHQTIRVMLLK